MDGKKSVVILSGGMDSTTLLYQLKREEHELLALGFNYGQRHQKELDFARKISDGVGVPFQIGNISRIGKLISGKSSLLNPEVEVPEGHYAEESMKATVVPNRNMIMLSIAIGYAIAHEFDNVAYAAHSGDHAIYPDCRTEFADVIDLAAQMCDWRSIRLQRPFVELTKADIAKLGGQLGVPYELTWSCYRGGELHCGKCGTCVERKEAFELAEVEDPTRYEEA